MSEATKDSFTRKALFLIGGVLLFRLLYVLLTHNTVAGDEAYYWDWGRRLDFGYYSKPPFIAWLFAFVDWVGNGSLYGIRAASAIIAAMTMWFSWKLGSEMFDRETGFACLLVGIAAPATSVLSYYLTIDAPLMVFWTVALWMFWRFVKGIQPGWSLVFLFLALGFGHLTKQMMMIFPVLAITFLFLGRDTRPLLRSPGLWISLVGSFLFLTPPLIWNWQNDWITFEHTKHHFDSGGGDQNFFVERASKFFEFVGTQMGVLSPIIAIVLFSLALYGLKKIRKVETPVRFLLVFCGIPLALILVMALRQKLQPNWPAVFYAAGLLLTAAWYKARFSFGFPPEKWRKFYPLAVGLGLSLVAVFYVTSPLLQAMGKDGHRLDPNRRSLGFDNVAAEFQALRETVPGYEDDFIVTHGHRHLTSYLAFYLPDQPFTYRFEPTDQILSQYELWPNPFENGFAGKDGLILVPGKDLPDSLEEAFERCELVGTFSARIGYDRQWEYSVYRGIGLKEWPKGAPVAASDH